MNTLSNRAGALALAGLAVTASLGGGCSSSSGAIQGRFSAVHNTMVSLGLSQLGHLSEGSLAEGGTVSFPLDLEPQCYTFVAFGGDGARDVDLSVLDANSARVAGDSTRDMQAVVRYCATTRGRYNLVLRMTTGGGSYLVGSWQGGSATGSGAQVASAGACANPLPIQFGQTVTGNTAESTDHERGSCNGAGGPSGGEDDNQRGAPEIAYTFTVERRQQVTVAVETTGNYDGTVYIRQGTCEDEEAEVACNDDDGDVNHSRISAALDPGQYFVFVDGFGGHRGRYSMTVTAADVPSPADVCQNAPALAPNSPVTGQTTTQDLNIFQARCANNARGPDRVYRLEVPRESRLQLHEESDFDGVLHIRRACVDPNTEVACNDDAEDTQHSRINTVLPAGTYYVFADGFRPNAVGNYTIEADLTPVAGGDLPGDTCADAVALTPGTPVEGNTFQAHDDLRSPCAAPADGYDVVYRMNVTARSRVQLWFENTDLGNQGTISVTRNCAQIAQATCRAGAVGEAQGFDQVLDPGQYFVVVDSAGARNFGRFRLNSRIEDPNEMERLCRAAPLLTPGRTVTGTTASGNSRFQASCGSGAQGPENLYRLVLARRSAVRLALTSSTPNFDAVLHIRQNCTQVSTERGCNDDAGDAQHSLIETTLDRGTYTVFVDGFGTNRQTNNGQYSLEVQVTPQ
jgi:hypothetical protein